MSTNEAIKSAAWIALSLILIPGCGTPEPQGQPERPPNVLMIMIDDLGWTDLHVQGNDRLETPVIDQLAAEGMRFTDNYAASPVCSPTRAAVITGQSPARLAITNHITGNQDQFQPQGASLRAAEMFNHLGLEHVTLAERLKGAGYATAFLGKWHLSGTNDELSTREPSRRPEFQGFDVNIGGVSFGGPPSYFDPYRNPAIEDREAGEYLTYRLADEAIGFIDEHKGEPFFVALWPYTVHWPMDAPQELVDKYAHRPGFGDHGNGIEASTRYAAMIEAMDTAIGRVLAKLDELDLAEETLVIFTSDNGGLTQRNGRHDGFTENLPLRRGKGSAYEGGVRVPTIIRWPGVTSAGTVCDEPIMTIDYYPTLLEMLGINGDAGHNESIDGQSIKRLLENPAATIDRSLYWHYPHYHAGGDGPYSAVRNGNYRLIEFHEDKSVRLYDLANDLGEQTDLAQEMPKKVDALRSQLHQWRVSVSAQMPTINPDYDPKRAGNKKKPR